LVELNSTKRKWTIAMEVALFSTRIVTAAAMKLPSFFVLSVACMFLMATLSATHDIACDGLYLMSLDRKRQAAFSGVMAMFSRLGRLFVLSIIVFIAGWLKDRGVGLQKAWANELGRLAIVYAAGLVRTTIDITRPQ